MDDVWAVNWIPAGSVDEPGPQPRLGYPPRVARSVDTACPNCGHSPIAETDERCPACYNWLRELPRFHSNRIAIHNDAEQEHGDAMQGTRIGGPDVITSAAEAYPGLSSTLLVALGLMLGLAGLGALPATGSPHAYLVLAAFDVISGILLFAYATVVRRVVAVTVPLQVVALLYVARSDIRLPEMIVLALVPLAVMAGTSGEPGPKLRSLAFCVGIGMLAYSAVVRIGVRSLGLPGALIDAPRLGFRAQLPAGFSQLGGLAELGDDYMSESSLDPQVAVFAFADPNRQLSGMWGLAPVGRYTPPRLAEGLASTLGGSGGAPKPVSADVGLKVPTSTFERGLAAGRVASVTAFKLPDERVAVLLIAGPTSDVERIRSELVRAASFAPAKARP